MKVRVLPACLYACGSSMVEQRNCDWFRFYPPTRTLITENKRHCSSQLLRIARSRFDSVEPNAAKAVAANNTGCDLIRLHIDDIKRHCRKQLLREEFSLCKSNIRPQGRRSARNGNPSTPETAPNCFRFHPLGIPMGKHCRLWLLRLLRRGRRFESDLHGYTVW